MASKHCKQLLYGWHAVNKATSISCASSSHTVQVMSGYDEIEKVAKFLHYYERYKGHKESLAVSASLGA